MPSISFKNFRLSFLGIAEINWEVNEHEQRAAWELYVELVTRITVQPLAEDEGILREALSSYYKLFDITRNILKHYGPVVAMPAKPDDATLGFVAVKVLNQVLRPLLARWHPLLQAHEQQRPAQMGSGEHERQWAHYADLRQAIANTRETLLAYADVLAEVSGVARLH